MYIGYFYIYIRSIGECYAKLKHNDEENLLFDSEENPSDFPPGISLRKSSENNIHLENI